MKLWTQRRKVDILNNLNLNLKEYFLVTAHRQENVDVKERLRGFLDGLDCVVSLGYIGLPLAKTFVMEKNKSVESALICVLKNK